MAEIRFAMGNDAIAEGAIAAGARFYAGYPITPSTEVAEISSERLPQEGGVYVQMEDEISSIAAVIGASAAGKKSFTSTAGPGISLMQENLGVAVMCEIPCVIIDVQRAGPSTGLATKPGQGDLMQTRWGTHGDHGIIALSPTSVQECYDLTIHAFNLAEKYRTPVYLLADEVVGHMREQYTLHEAQIIDRKPAEEIDGIVAFNVYDFEKYEDGICPMPAYGGKYLIRHNASTHDETGFASNVPSNAGKFVRHYTEKISAHKDEICMTERICLDDADYAIISFGGSVRSALAAMHLLRNEGIKAGVLKVVTVWPFPDEEVSTLLGQVKTCVIPELNLGQMIGEVKRCNSAGIPIIGVNRVDGNIIHPEEIVTAVKEAMQ